MDVLTGPRDMDKVKRELKAAGYKGEKVVLLAATDFPVLKAMSDVAADMLKQAGMNVDYVATDWGTRGHAPRQEGPAGAGRLERLLHRLGRHRHARPGGHFALRGNGEQAWFGWPTDPKIEQLRNDWFARAGRRARRRRSAREIQQEALDSVPYIPMGQYLQPTAYRDEPRGRAERVRDLLERQEGLMAPMITRRAALAGALALPAVARGEGARVLRMVPQANLASLDPIFTTANMTRNHGFMVYDTLYGMAAQLEPQPQMADGPRRWIMAAAGLVIYPAARAEIPRWRARAGARRASRASSRWAARNPIGQKLATVLAASRRWTTSGVHFVLQRPFPMLFNALAAPSQPGLHHAGAGREDRPLQADRRHDRLRPVPLQARRIQFRQPRRLRAQPGLRAEPGGRRA